VVPKQNNPLKYFWAIGRKIRVKTVLQSTSLDTVLLQPIGRESFSEIVSRTVIESYKVIPYS